MKVDYIIRNGRVIDPSADTDEVRDLYVKNMRIVEPDDEAVCDPDRVIHAEGRIVTPGLIDFHTHLFHEGSTISIHPDMMIAQGTTAAVDAGSAGTATFEAFYKSVLSSSQVHLKSYLTVYSGGQLDFKLCEDFNPALYNLDKMERVIEKYRDVILGLKVRLSKGVVPDETESRYLKAAVDLAERINRDLGTDLGVCVHTTNPPVSAGELAQNLRKGDIYTHCYQGMGSTIVREDGTIDPLIEEARSRGVIFDSANGKGNFGLACAKKAIAAGFLPDVISSDLTVDKFNMPPYCKNLPYVLSKYLAMGVELKEVIRRATVNPAKLMRMEDKIGTLKPGTYADIAIFDLKDVRHIQKDFAGEEIVCEKVLVPQLTMLEGEIQYCQADFYI